jgi:hypothetical protein
MMSTYVFPLRGASSDLPAKRELTGDRLRRCGRKLVPRIRHPLSSP